MDLKKEIESSTSDYDEIKERKIKAPTNGRGRKEKSKCAKNWHTSKDVG